MSALDPKYDAVVCRNCIRAFDVDYDNELRNVRVIEKKDQPDGWELIIFEAECPLCFTKETYTNREDARFGGDVPEKMLAVYKLENELLRKRLLKHEERIARFEKETTRLRKENRKFADIIHKVQEAGKGEQLQEVEDVPSTPPRRQTTSTSHNRYIT